MKISAATALLVAASLSGNALAGQIGVAPLRIELSPTTKSTVVTVTGKTGPGQFLQVSAMRWTQDAQGRDRYEETADLVFLPKSIDLAKSGKQLIRIGVEKPVTDVEKTYRLFIRETPPPLDPNRQKGAQIAVVVDFGLPVFLMPAKPAPRVQIQQASVDKGVLTITVANTGNVRVKLRSLSAGKAGFADFKDWYLLAGARRTFTTTVPPASCNGPLTVQLRTEMLDVKRQVALTPQMCG
jgi:fimbrial chaperone protein